MFTLKLGEPGLLRPEAEIGFVGKVISCITEAENMLRRTSAPYHPECMDVLVRAYQTI